MIFGPKAHNFAARLLPFEIYLGFSPNPRVSLILLKLVSKNKNIFPLFMKIFLKIAGFHWFFLWVFDKFISLWGSTPEPPTYVYFLIYLNFPNIFAKILVNCQQIFENGQIFINLSKIKNCLKWKVFDFPWKFGKLLRLQATIPL